MMPSTRITRRIQSTVGLLTTCASTVPIGPTTTSQCLLLHGATNRQSPGPIRFTEYIAEYKDWLGALGLCQCRMEFQWAGSVAEAADRSSPFVRDCSYRQA